MMFSSFTVKVIWICSNSLEKREEITKAPGLTLRSRILSARPLEAEDD